MFQKIFLTAYLQFLVTLPFHVARAESPLCENKHNMCDVWADSGKCNEDKSLHDRCPESCGFCKPPIRQEPSDPLLGQERIVVQLEHGTLELGLYASVAPATVTHITRLVELGALNTNHFYAIERGVVAQVCACLARRSSRKSWPNKQ